MSKKLIFLTSFLLILGLVGANAALGQDAFLQDGGPDGIVSIEAESFLNNTPQGEHAWELLTDVEGFTGTGFMQPLPNSGANTNTIEDYTTISPRLDYEVFFVTSGIHYVWVRGFRISGSDDSAHVAIDAIDTGGGDADRMQTGSTDGAWEWSTQRREDLGPAQVEVDGAGIHTISVWMREDGWIFDKIVLTTNPDFVPEGEGPAVSEPGLPVGAYGAEPANGAVDVKDTPVLTWMADETAFQHDLFLGTDADLVAAGDASVSQGSLSEARFDIAEPLERGITYYWKVDVSTGTSRASELHPGNVWSFRVADENTDSWLAAASKDSPAYLDTFVEDGLYDIGALSGDITYEFVVLSNPDETEASMALIGRRQFGDTQVGIKYEQWNNTGTYGATVFGVVDLDYGVSTAPGEYTHLTFVSSETTNTTALYVNGVLAGSVDSAITLSGLVGIGYGAQGEDMSGSFDNFDGIIFGVAIYDEALTDEQIAAHADSYFNPFEEIVPTNPGTDGLVAFFPLENDTLDASGNGNDGTIVGDPIFVEGPAGYGMGMEFDGDDHVDTGNLEDLAEWTIGCWAKSPVAPSGDAPSGPVHREQNYQFNWNHSSDTFRASATVSAGGWHAASLGTLEADTWYYLAGSYDGEVLKAYRDGELITANEDPSGPPAAESNSLKLARHAAAEQFFTGTVDEAIVYSRVLSEAEILYLAGIRATPVDPGTDNLAAAYVFDADAADSSGNGLDGTLLGDAHVADGVLVLDGDDDAVAIPGIGDGLTEFTFIMNVYPTVDQVPLQFSGGINTDSWGGGVHFKLNNGNINVGVNGLGGGDVVGTSIIEPDMWTQLALTVSPTEVAVYVNGEKEGSRTGEVVPAVNIGAATIGAWNNSGTDVQREMTGMMDDVLFYDRALSTGEIRYLAGFRAMDNPGTDALIAAYAFENDLLDGSGNGNDATANGDPAFVEGVAGMALEFDADGDFLDCGANPILALTDAVSISAWIKVAVSGADHKVGGNQDGANGGYKMSVYGDKIEFEIRTAANSAVLNRSVEGGTIIEVDTWYHVVGVYSLEDGYIRTYVDGELDRELLTTEALGASPGPLMIGCEPFNTGSYQLNGVMDEVRVYNKALSAAEARYLANN